MIKQFFLLEGGYLILGSIILLVTLFVTTRPFMSQGAIKRGLMGVTAVLGLFIGSHFYVTINRMASVKIAFENGQTILCESRMQRKVAQTITIEKSNEWQLVDGNFKSPNFKRVFHSARCIVK